METCDISDSEQSENEKDERQTSTKASSDTHSASSSSQHASYSKTTAESLRSDIAMRFMPTLDFGPPSSQLVTESVRARHAITMLSSMFGQPLEELPDHFVFKQREGFISDLLGFVIILEATQERLVQLPKTVSSLLSPASMPRLMSCNLREKTLHGNSASGGFSTIFELKDQA
ncbi:hypothetical protein CDL15_Pgr018575 [Punica granatum]|uniref:Uncharacterized protein n=1 Tax=Punica granatum TaxID=22663 RepID=A0A218WZN2_PUNGR|nr:hypothetical protein CDL15_Pgr018575 [Punica granatum]